MSFSSDIWQTHSTPLKLGAAIVVLLTVAVARRRDPFEGIPKVGSSNPLWSFVDGIVFMSKAQAFVTEGYQKYSKQGIFRVPTPIGWLVVISGQKYIHELRNQRGNQLSALEAMRQVTAGDHTFGPEIFDKPYHLPLVRTKLTRYIGSFFENTRHEVILACSELLPSDSNWKTVNVCTVGKLIIGQAANRSYVNDASIYRDPGYLHVMVNFAKDVSETGALLRFSPEFLKPVLVSLLTNTPTSVKSAVGYLSITIEDRVRKFKEYGPDYPGREEDMLSWFIDIVDEEDRNIRHLALCILHLNVAAIVTTSMALYVVLYSLASRPEYIEPLRQEIELVVADYGWSKASTSRMQKLDSFIMETMRFHPPAIFTSPRLATADYVFSSGVRVPKNSLVLIASLARQMDDEIYPNAKVFDGFRFCKSHDSPKNLNSEQVADQLNDFSTGTSASSRFTALSTDYLLFGVGEHACPGRFFAANLLKISLSHILMTYDFKLDPAHPPSGRYVIADYTPGLKDVLFFRKRKNI